MEYLTVDIDGHVAEPIQLMMDEYLDPEFKDRPMRLLRDDKGYEYLEFDGKKSAIAHGGIQLGLDGGKAYLTEDLTDFYTPGKVSYYDGMIPAANDPHARIKWMDEEKIDKSLFYPTAGLFWEDGCEDPRVAAAYCRAYNSWLLDFCKPYPDRLICVAHIPTADVQEAVKEARRTAKLGAKGFMIGDLPTNGRMYGDPYFDPFFAEVQEMGVPLGVHRTCHQDYIGKDVYGDSDSTQSLLNDYWYFAVATSIPLQIVLLNLINRGALDRFPRLKFVFLESGATWIVHWLERMDEHWETEKYVCSFKLRPSEYFQRQCWISFEPDEKLIPHVIKQVGADKFFWASDFPHHDGYPGIVNMIKKAIKPLPEDDQQKVLGENAMTVYGLS